MKKRIPTLMAVATLTGLMVSCGASLSGIGGELTGARLASWSEPAPYGMIKIPRGHIVLGTDSIDSLWGEPAVSRAISVDAFWMDRNEVTNAQYRQFVYYVRDSIIRERLADPAYGGDESYKITEDSYGEPIKPYLDWSKPLPVEKRASDEELRALNSVYYTNPVTGQRILDPRQMLYRYEVYDHRSAALYRYQLLRPKGNEHWHTSSTEQIIISKDTAYIATSGEVVRQTITRPLSSEYDFLNTYIVPIYPDESVWVNDFPNSTNETYTRMYFNHPGYDDYPVVGVSWEQATAFCAWRTAYYLRGVKVPEGQMVESFRLPTEAEWEYAARAGDTNNVYPWGTSSLRSDKGCFLGNFKPDEGNYTADKHLVTARVGSYSPNDYGLFDMAGNVAEWTSTSWSLAGHREVDDVNPELGYSVSLEDPYIRTRKVTKGGSWKDIARYIRANTRTSEHQDRGRSFIGFRCVRTAIDFNK